jgi:VWFA-related protein
MKRSLCCFAVSLMLVGTGAGQENRQESWTARFSAAIDVPIVNIEVLASDRHGRPVTGLSAADFEVLDNGERVEITHFAAPTEPGYATPLPPADVVQEDPGQAPAKDPLTIILYYNSRTIDITMRRSILKQVRAFLEGLETIRFNLRLLLISYDNHLRVQVPFTEDVDLILAGFDVVDRSASHSLMGDKMALQREIMNLQSPQAEMILQKTIASWSRIETIKLRAEIAAIERLLRSLGGIEGHKAFLYLGGSIPIYPGEDLFKLHARRFRSSFSIDNADQDNDLFSELESLVQVANSQRVSFFTLDTFRHLAGQSIYHPSNPGISKRAAVMPTSSLTGAEAPIYLAESTGGRTLWSLSRLAKHLDEVVSELRTSYSLAFTPPSFGEGLYHQIKVSTRIKGIKLRHRNGYLDRDDLTQIRNRTLAAAVHGIFEDRLGIEVAEVRREAQEKETFALSILVKVPLTGLTLISDQGRLAGRLSLFFAVSSTDGTKISEVSQLEIPISIEPEQSESNDAGFGFFPANILVRTGSQRLAIGLMDEISRIKATRVFALEMPEPPSTIGASRLE